MRSDLTWSPRGMDFSCVRDSTLFGISGFFLKYVKYMVEIHSPHVNLKFMGPDFSVISICIYVKIRKFFEHNCNYFLTHQLKHVFWVLKEPSH